MPDLRLSVNLHALPPFQNARRHVFFYRGDFSAKTVFTDLDNVELLRTAFRTVKTEHPFTIDAFVLLPQHFHCLLTLPLGDKNYPMRWSAIKKYFTDHCPAELKTRRTAAQLKKRAQTVWQPRYWEHQIRDEQDFEKHCDYIHWNPVKHGLVARPGDWPYSSFHQFVRRGIYPREWAVMPGRFDNADYGE
jgi:putative transposase